MKTLIVTAWFAVIFSFQFYKRDQNIFLLFMSFSLWAARILGQGAWYGIYNSASVFLLIVITYNLISTYFTSKLTLFNTCFLLFTVTGGLFINIFSWPFSEKWYGMKMPVKGVAYCSKADIKAITHSLESFISKTTIQRIYTVPQGDGMLFDRFFPADWSHVLPIFTSKKADYFILHQSRYLDTYSHSCVSEILKHHKSDLIYSRNETEKWFLISPPNSKVFDILR